MDNFILISDHTFAVRGLPPSLRGRKRYIAFKLISEEKVDARMLSRELNQSMISLFGECFTAGSMLKLEHFDGEKGILRCRREYLNQVIIALTLLREVGGVKVVPLTLGVSGTLKSCKRKYVEV